MIILSLVRILRECAEVISNIVFSLVIDSSYDALLAAAGRSCLRKRYLLDIFDHSKSTGEERGNKIILIYNVHV